MISKFSYWSLSSSKRFFNKQKKENIGKQKKNIFNIHSIEKKKPLFRITNRTRRRARIKFISSLKKDYKYSRILQNSIEKVRKLKNRKYTPKLKKKAISKLNFELKKKTKRLFAFNKKTGVKRMIAKYPSKRFFVNFKLQGGKGIISKKYNKFIGLLTKNGNKVKAENILKSAFLKLYKRTGMSYFWFLPKVLNKLSNHFEIKKVVRSKKKKKKKKNKKESFNLVPFPLNTTRQFFYTLKWINEGAKMNTRKVDYAEKLSREIFSIVFRKSKSKALFKQKQLRKQAIENKSNGHFRW